MAGRKRSFDAARSWLRGHVSAEQLPVAVLGIATSAGIEMIEAFGKDEGRTAQWDDEFALFSVSKPLIGLTALRAVERGSVSLTTPLTSAIPDFGRNRDDTVQLRHLLTHTAGLVEPPLDAPELRGSLIRSPQLFRAGTVVQYSNLAFDGVRAILEHAVGSSLEKQLEQFAVDAEMPGLTFDADNTAHKVHGAVRAGFDYAAMQSLNHPAAGLYATATDLLSLGMKLLRTSSTGDTAVLHPSTLKAMLQIQTAGLPVIGPTATAPGQDFGLTWLLRHSAPDLLERDLFGHGGWSGTQFWIYPQLDLCFTLLTNILDPQLNGVELDQLNNAVVSGWH